VTFFIRTFYLALNGEMNLRLLKKLKETADFIANIIDIDLDLGLVLGSGLGVLVEEIEKPLYIPYNKIPNFPVSTVEGHEGQLVIGKLEGKHVMAMKGRFHYYEGYSMQELVFPIRLMKVLGIKKLLVTNAAGGINLNFNPGDLMLISDHINLMGDNPLRGTNHRELGPRFPDMSEAYDKKFIHIAENIASKEGILCRKGVYVGLSGPAYETPAEIRYLAKIGADAVGMSTIPEVIAANHMRMRILGISCITNMAAGILPQVLRHEEVIETAELVKDKFICLARGILKNI
jgi:purine-nucleoside phosphorylase